MISLRRDDLPWVGTQKWANPREPGPWDTEPDWAEWMRDDIACLVLRMPSSLVLNGYIAVPHGHPWDGVAYEALGSVMAHGGLTYSDRGFAAFILHECEQDQDRWWVGFDCGHSGDLMPSFARSDAMLGQEYRNFAYVVRVVNSLADTALAAAHWRT